MTEVMYKCRFCGQKDIEQNMVDVRDGVYSSQFGWYHEACIKLRREKIKCYNTKMAQLEELVNVVRDIHDIEMVPKWMFLKFNEFVKEKDIHGNQLEYRILTEAYKLARKKIDFIKRNKFESVNQELRVGYKVMSIMINDAYRNIMNTEESE